MARLIKTSGKIKEGEVFNKFLENRMIRHNQNVLTAITGPTGSGKSYQDLRRAELWYRNHFKKEFPPRNICFSIAEVMKIVTDPKLKKGEVIIFEEVGCNLGSLDFHNKVQKVFTYVLQSFRSMNIAIFFNLPYLTMLNKSARTLIHVHFQTVGIDRTSNVSKSKGFFRQVNQSSGKIYDKYMRIRHNGKKRVIKRFNYNLPSKWLSDIYEQKKLRFITDFTEDFSKDVAIQQRDELVKQARVNLTNRQMDVYEMLQNGMTMTEIAKDGGVTPQSVSDVIQSIRRKGYKVVLPKKRLENQGLKA